MFLIKFFSVKDYWYRFEWQHRGSPHIHGLLWLDDAPDCDKIDSITDDQRQDIIDYFDGIVQAQLGRLHSSSSLPQNPCRRRFSDLTNEELEDDLDMLLSSIQRHTKCGSHCMQKKRNSNILSCRFGYPIQCQEESTLFKDAGVWKFLPKRNDNLLQRYNQFVTQLWRGNTDFSAITSKDAVINYICTLPLVRCRLKHTRLS